MRERPLPKHYASFKLSKLVSKLLNKEWTSLYFITPTGIEEYNRLNKRR